MHLYSTTKLEEVFLATLTESTTPLTRMPRDLSKASLIPSNKRDTSAEEMGVIRTQEEDPKKTSQSNSKFLPRSGRKGGVGGDGGSSITGLVFAATGEDQPHSEIDSLEERS
ncbi:hypothetical protein CEXT_69551 [Caerostris extrusa]|uniref:Uncharacterized protein n=1 Tax=Caerostris extrusa TaxID=172846 RepID=A0AAV4TB10_CAEEX|nr:hypothetical protein CEXT_69551 [Caerostris extrusa]